MALLPLLTAVVIAVSDGDTIQASAAGRSVTIHLACIDAPEIGQAPNGAISRAKLLSVLPSGAQISVTPLQTDRKSQVTAVVFHGTENINLQMVRSGQAFSTAGQEAQCDFLRYGHAESTAQAQRLGVWAADGGIKRPWTFRAEKAYEDPSPPRTYRGPAHVNLGVMTGTTAPSPSTSEKSLLEMCIAKSRETWMATSGGIAPPPGMTKEYCECATSALQSGDTLTKSVEFCRSNVYRKYGLKEP